MHLASIQRINGLLLIIFSITLLPSVAVSLYYQDSAIMALLIVFMVMFGLGLLLWFPVRHNKRDLNIQDAFLVTALFWTMFSLIGALPFVLTLKDLTLAQAVFESISGFTTTGATVISSGLDGLPKSILYYRQQLQWLGGLGVIVLAVAVVPLLGIGGMQLYRAETSGPMRDDRFTPRIGQTAKMLLFIYLFLTICCALAYWLAGMRPFDAVCHSYTTVSTGGFSTHDASLKYYDSLAIELICMVFMLLASLNFTVHYLVWHHRNIRQYWYDIQGRVFISIVLALIGIATFILVLENRYDFWTALRYASFQVISIITSTGYLTEEFHEWPMFLPVLIMGSGFIGGCVGSTTGGIRVVRIILLYKQAVREIMRLIHPSAVITVKIGRKRISDNVAQAVWGFIFLYMSSYLLLSMLFMMTGADAITAFSAVATTLNMGGPSLGEFALSFQGVSDFGLWILSFAMLLGRLEVFTLLVLLTPAFWRR